MANGVVRARIDPELELRGTEILKVIGLTPSEAFRLMMVRVCADKRLPFEPLVPSRKTIAAIEAARRGDTTKAGSVENMFKMLNADD
jgi:DNA-damage-inducible protein J